MAKALYGHMAHGDVQLAAEVRRLRRQVAALELELAEMRRGQLDEAIRLEIEPDLATPATV